MPQAEHISLWELTAAAGLDRSRFLADAAGAAELADIARCSGSSDGIARFVSRNVLISTVRQLPAALALLALDGIARRLVLCPPDLAVEHLPALMSEAGVEIVVTDGTGPAADSDNSTSCEDLNGWAVQGERAVRTEWVLLTSGTLGQPKLVVHTLASLIGPLQQGPARGGTVWSTFYDIRRYGGLQVLLRALVGGGSVVLSQAEEPVTSYLARAVDRGVTHILGTPTHWRRALMSPVVARLAPQYVRLSGEVAHQSVLDRLARAFPSAAVTHAYASTEAGVGFEVNDGREGFPASTFEPSGSSVELKLVDDSLRIRSPRTALGYLGSSRALADPEGFVDTGDIVRCEGERCYFVGRREGIINVGGQKVHPEEVEAVISRHPAVQMARVTGRPNPITGMLVVAELVLREPGEAGVFARVRDEIVATCRAELAVHKVPAIVRELAFIEPSPAGKLDRRRA